MTCKKFVSRNLVGGGPCMMCGEDWEAHPTYRINNWAPSHEELDDRGDINANFVFSKRELKTAEGFIDEARVRHLKARILRDIDKQIRQQIL